MKPSRIGSAYLRLAKSERASYVKFLGVALNSTSAQGQVLNGKRPVPDVRQVHELQKIGKELVEAAVMKGRAQKKKGGKNISLEERRQMDELKMKEISLSNKAKSQERLKFESSSTDNDVVDITSPLINNLNRLQPGDFVELRRY
jgi:hypothetical protein